MSVYFLDRPEDQDQRRGLCQDEPTAPAQDLFGLEQSDSKTGFRPIRSPKWAA